MAAIKYLIKATEVGRTRFYSGLSFGSVFYPPRQGGHGDRIEDVTGDIAFTVRKKREITACAQLTSSV